MLKVLFLIHDLGQGGAEKVLVNLVNNMDSEKFDISVTVLFGGGVNEQFLEPHIHFHTVWPRAIPGNSKLMKLLTPRQLHKICVKEHYDIEVSYLEGPSARIISGCTNSDTKLVSWIHTDMKTKKQAAASFRNVSEASRCYHRFDRTVCVSKNIRDSFCRLLDFRGACSVLYNTVESEKIKASAAESAPELLNDQKFRLVAVGTLKEVKGYARLLRIVHQLSKAYPIHLYILGSGPLQQTLEAYIEQNHLQDTATLLGYQRNPYRFVAKCNLFVCSSYAEGFSTAAAEALIVGTPVCTVEVSGMKEMLGKNNEYGVVTDNKDDALYQGIKKLLDNPSLLAHYKCKAVARGCLFDAKSTTLAVEDMFRTLCEAGEKI